MHDVVGVVAMVHGSATDLTDDSIRDYLSRVMQGRTPSPAQVADLRRRYEAVGGTSTLRERSARQVEVLRQALGPGHRVVLGAKHSAPFIADAVRQLVDEGARRVVGIALAPHESWLTTGQYDELGAKAAAEHDAEWRMVRSWHAQEELVELWADLVAEERADATDADIRFSAHSLPTRAGDPYPSQVDETAGAVARKLALRAGEWRVVYQSVPPGVDPSEWLGPNLSNSFGESGGRVLVAPIGFVSDHLEILYDLDVQARAEAAVVGVELTRTRMPNDDPRLARAMAAAIMTAITTAG